MNLVPKKLDDFIINKIYADRLKKTNKYELPNMLFTGDNNSGKKTLLDAYLNYIFDTDIKKQRKMAYYQLKIGNNSVDIDYISSPFHIEINLYEYGLYDKSIITDFIKDIIPFHTINQHQYRIIIFNHFDKVSNIAQESLKMLMDSSTTTTRYFFLAESCTKINPSILSRCCIYRIPKPNYSDINNYLNIISKKYFSFSNSVIDKIINSSQLDLFKLNNIIDCTSKDTKFNVNKLDNINRDLIKIYKLIEKRDLSSIIEIRSICYNLLLLNFIPNDIFNSIVNYFSNHKNLTDIEKRDLINFASELEGNMQKIEHDIICIEFLILKVKKLLLSK